MSSTHNIDQPYTRRQWIPHQYHHGVTDQFDQTDRSSCVIVGDAAASAELTSGREIFLFAPRPADRTLGLYSNLSSATLGGNITVYPPPQSAGPCEYTYASIDRILQLLVDSNAKWPFSKLDVGSVAHVYWAGMHSKELLVTAEALNKPTETDDEFPEEALQSHTAGQGFEDSSRPIGDVFTSRVRALASLEYGWDGGDGLPISSAVQNYTLQLLGSFMQATSIPPAVVPLSSGGLQLEWFIGKHELEIEIEKADYFVVNYENLEEQATARVFSVTDGEGVKDVMAILEVL